MLKSGLIMFLMLFSVLVNGQINDPVKWNFSAVKIAGNTYEIHLSAGIDDNWHVYSQDAGDVPAATTISFTSHPLISFDGKVIEAGKLENFFDKNLNIRLKYYAKKVDFIQKIKLKSPVTTVVKGTISFVVCNDRTCLPPKDVPFAITVSGKYN